MLKIILNMVPAYRMWQTLPVFLHHIFQDFSRLFKAVTGSSYTEYITAVRLQHAKILLEIGEISISAVANKVGISNASYLSALLKKHYGITPTQIKRNAYRNDCTKYNNRIKNS